MCWNFHGGPEMQVSIGPETLSSYQLDGKKDSRETKQF